MTERKPTIPEVAVRFRAYHLEHPTWGALHIVLEDGNLEDNHVVYCRVFALELGDEEGAELAMILSRMSQTQRAKISARL